MHKITLKQFNGMIAVSYKENYCNGIPNDKDINHKIIATRWASINPYIPLEPNNPATSKEFNVSDCFEALTLENRNNSWLIKNFVDSALNTEADAGCMNLLETDVPYIMVTMPDSFMRIAKHNSPECKILMQYAKYARYAAEVYFDERGNIKSLNKISYKGLSLESKNNRWYIKDNLNSSMSDSEDDNNVFYTPEADELYIFVTMLDSTIRIAKRSTHGHLMLSDYSKYVLYAGEVRFDDKGNIKFWNNNSLSYSPPPMLAEQSGFAGCMQQFQLVIDRNDPIKDRDKAFSCESITAIVNVSHTQVTAESSSHSESVSTESSTETNGATLRNNSIFSATKSSSTPSLALWRFRPFSPILAQKLVMKQ